MLAATALLVLIGLLGAFDIAYYHTYCARLVLRPEARREAWIHVVRGYVYALQFLVVPNLRLAGAAYAGLVLLFALDVAVAAADVLAEPRARAAQGGLAPGEYVMHVALSVLVGALLCRVAGETAGWARAPTVVAIEPHAPAWLRALAAAMAVGSAAVATLEALVLREQARPAPPPLHVRVRLDAPLARVWNLTQDHRLHPRWDRRFDRIVMAHEDAGGAHDAPAGVPDPRIAAGTLMRYERRLLGLTVRGFGRYKLHRAMRQSTFEFWSDDWRSFIRRGVGLWIYTALPDGSTEFATSYTYEVRGGALGRALDRWLFRPLFQRLTEQSFRRLARDWFGQPRPRVLGRGAGRRPARFAAPTPAAPRPPTPPTPRAEAAA